MNALRTGSRHPVTRVAFSPDGAGLAAAAPHHGVSLYGRARGGLVRTVGNPREADYLSVLYSSCGTRLVVSGQKGLVVYDTASGGVVGACPHAQMKLHYLATPGDELRGASRWLAYAIGMPPWPPAGLPRHRLLWSCRRGAGFAIGGVSADGRWAAGGGENDPPVLIDGLTGRAVAALGRPRGSVPEAAGGRGAWQPVFAFAPAGDRLVVGDGRAVCVFDAGGAGPGDTGGEPAAGAAEVAPPPRAVLEPVFRLTPPDEWPAGEPWRPPVALTPDGRGLLVRRPRQRVQLWDVDSATLANEWGWRLEVVTCLAVAPDGLTAAAGGRFGRVVVWDLG